MMYRKVSLLRILLSAMMIQLIFNPGEIASASFQLSYLAVGGIVLVYPWLSGFYPEGSGRFNPVRKVWQLACLSISCQLFTAPAAWLRFRSFPKYFLLANLLAIFPATILTASSIGMVVLAPVGLCPGALVSIADFSARLLVYVLRIISEM